MALITSGCMPFSAAPRSGRSGWLATGLGTPGSVPPPEAPVSHGFTQLQSPWRIRTAAASCKVTDPGGLSVAEANDTIDAMSVLAAALPASALTSLDLSANELPIVAVQVR